MAIKPFLPCSGMPVTRSFYLGYILVLEVCRACVGFGEEKITLIETLSSKRAGPWN